MNRLAIVLAAVSLFAVLHAPASAQVPQTVSYQGVLTDVGGAIAPDGTYDVTFSLYSAASGGSLLWAEPHTGANGVQVVRGGFSVTLGSLSPLTLGFSAPLWLGIQVGADPELTPRVALTASPYALGLQLPFSLGTATNPNAIRGSDYYGYGGTLEGADASGARTWVLWPDIDGGGGFVDVARSAYSDGFFIDGNTGGTGNPSLNMLGTSSTLLMDLSQSGNASVQLPPNAISATETLDEPGLAQGHANNNVNVSSTMSDIVTVTITTPAAGYILVEGSGSHVVEVGSSAGASSYNRGFFQIDESAGGGLDPNHYVMSGYLNTTITTAMSVLWFPFTVRSTYYKPAGTYTFRLEGQSSQNTPLTSYVWSPTITATYLPTSYGAVTTSPPPGEESSFADVRVTPVASALRGTPDTPGMIAAPGKLVDLRELEVRVARAEAVAAGAQRALAEARLAAQRRAGEDGGAAGARK